MPSTNSIVNALLGFGAILMLTLGVLVFMGAINDSRSRTKASQENAQKAHDAEVISMTKFCLEYYKWAASQNATVEGMEKHCAPYR